MENRQKPVDGKSQGQIFQKSQGQSGFHRRKVENPKVEYFRNPKVKSQCPIGKCAKTTTQKKTGLTGEKWKPPNGKSQGQIDKTGFNRKKAVLTGKSVTKNKKPKTLKEMSIY